MRHQTYQTYLHVDIKNADASFVTDRLDSLDRGSVEVTRELGVLDKFSTLNAGQELLSGHKVVIDTVGLSSTRGTSGVYTTSSESTHNNGSAKNFGQIS